MLNQIFEPLKTIDTRNPLTVGNRAEKSNKERSKSPMLVSVFIAMSSEFVTLL